MYNTVTSCVICLHNQLSNHAFKLNLKDHMRRSSGILTMSAKQLAETAGTASHTFGLESGGVLISSGGTAPPICISRFRFIENRTLFFFCDPVAAAALALSA